MNANQQRRSFIGRALAVFGISAFSVGDSKGASVSGVGYGVDEQAQDGPMMALGYVSRLLPDGYVHCQPPMKMAHDIVAHVKTQLDESERREVALAWVSVAALGGTGALVTAQRSDWGWHPAYQDALNLRRKFDAALRMISERIPSGQQIMFYPCGCAALGNLPDGDMLPLNCGSEGHERGAASIVRGMPPKPRPTIEELEAILAQDGNGPAVTILPNGQVTA